jgi:hypothetical protein
MLLQRLETSHMTSLYNTYVVIRVAEISKEVPFEYVNNPFHWIESRPGFGIKMTKFFR